MPQLSLFEAAAPIIERLATQRHHHRPSPLAIPLFSALALLQKSLRRNETAFALSAAATLLDQSPERLFRRLAAISVEDVGLANLPLVEFAVSSSASKTFRKHLGGDWPVAAALVTALCRSARDRAVDDCYIVSRNHIELAELRASLGKLTAPELIELLRDRRATFTRAIAAWRAAGADWSERGSPVGKPLPKQVFTVLAETGTSAATVALAARAFTQTREALAPVLAVLEPLRPSGVLDTVDDDLPPTMLDRAGLPVWMHDKFSHPGIAAIKALLGRPCEFSRWVRDQIEPRKRLRFAGETLFRVESGLCLSRVQYPAALTLRRLADENFHGLRLADPREPLELLRNDLPLLNEVRRHV
jgi:hypothetical protein